jgi:hypothetical protein
MQEQRFVADTVKNQGPADAKKFKLAFIYHDASTAIR